ncbi:serpin family protein [Pedobacter jamesrossensis]|uniref:Uncharacterized protein n=1 Tax=Pedobacter jamesrossensis TaxID=1908238 RepID=A0ABV8NFM0_9SPHI
MNKKLILFVFAFGLLACNQREESKANTDLLYFDVKGYFANEIIRLNKLNPQVIKQVIVNGTSETKTVKIADWTKEFDVFINADINKASWKGSFKAESNSESEHYTSSSKKIPVKNMLVSKVDDKVKKIEIIIANKNILYTSGDTLTYYPDSLYHINKHQKIKLLSAKSYQIIGRF